MNIRLGYLFIFLFALQACKQKDSYTTQESKQTLLWEISGNGLREPSFFYGTMHIMCAQDAKISPNFNAVLHNIDQVYFEIDMDDMVQLFGTLQYMDMRKDTTLSDLLTKEEETKIKNYFATHTAVLPYEKLKHYKPMLIGSLIEENIFPCDKKSGMEETIMDAVYPLHYEIKGLETGEFQASIFDSIPYHLQAKQLVQSIDSAGKQKASGNELLEAYKTQDLLKIESLMSSESSDVPKAFEAMLLQNRNKRWVVQFDSIANKKATLFAVGAAHLVGKEGVLNLLKEKGYTVRPLLNK
jgi:uncharacterized protein